MTGILTKRSFVYGSGRSEYIVVPDGKRMSITPTVRPSRHDREGDKVEVSFKQIKNSYSYVGEIIKNFGPAEDARANYDAILSEFEIETEFSPDALSIAEQAASEELSHEGRTVLDHEVIFTIDGADAKDLDDAVSLVRLPKGRWLLGVHIADVSHYVKPNTALDREAMRRGTSVYFTDKVVPMLPPVLSNGACSLNAGEDKYALSAHITLSSDGKIEGCKIRKTVINSRVRGVYSEVNSVLEAGADSPFYKKYACVYPTLKKMHELYLILAENAKKRGEERKRERAEARIKELEEEIERLDEELFGSAATDYVRAAEIDERKNANEEELLSLYETVM
jgi:ribonuclease R